VTTSTLVDTNVFIDVLGPQTAERQWSLKLLKRCAGNGDLMTNVVIWSELAASPLTEEQLTAILAWLDLRREAIPFEAAYRGGKAHRMYRCAGGRRDRMLPDFLIGAHAERHRRRLPTRDAIRYPSYFPSLDLITPETHP
jgi:predicted nucleic acid-binding protein